MLDRIICVRRWQEEISTFCYTPLSLLVAEERQYALQALRLCEKKVCGRNVKQCVGRIYEYVLSAGGEIATSKTRRSVVVDTSFLTWWTFAALRHVTTPASREINYQ